PLCLIWCETAEKVRVGRPSTATIRSPACRPAAAAGVPASTAPTWFVGRWGSDGPPPGGETAKRGPNRRGPFPAGPRRRTRDRLRGGRAEIGLGRGSLLHVAERPLCRPPRAG